MVAPDDGEVQWLARNKAEIDRLETENAKLRSDLGRARRREVSPEFLHKLDAVTDERDKLLLQYREAAKMAFVLLGYIHSMKRHDGGIQDCTKEPCPATVEFLGKHEKRNDQIVTVPPVSVTVPMVTGPVETCIHLWGNGTVVKCNRCGKAKD